MHIHLKSSILDYLRLALPATTPITIEAMNDCKPTPKKRPRLKNKHVFVEMPTGHLLHWMVAEPFTIEKVKQLILIDEGIPIEQQRLVIEAPNDRSISNPVEIKNETRFILMPIDNNFKAKEEALEIKGDTADQEDQEKEDDEKEEDKEEEDATDQEEAEEEFSSTEWIGAELFGDGQDMFRSA